MAAGCLSTSSAEYELNTDFEAVENGKPLQWSYWYGDTSDYAIALDRRVKRQGEYALRIEARRDSPRQWAGVVGSRLPVWFKMHQVQLRGYLKRDSVSEGGFAGLWCRVSRRDGYPRSEEHSDYGVPPSEDWTWYELRMPIDESSMEMTFGGILHGGGRVWLDSLSLSVDGQPYEHAASRAAAAIEAIWLPQLREQVVPFSPGSPPGELPEQLAGQRLTVLWLADDGLHRPLQLARWLFERGDFDWLLVNAAGPQTSQYAQSIGQGQAPTSGLDSLMNSWVPSQDLAQVLRSGIERQQLAGIDLGTPYAALQRLAPHMRGRAPWPEVDRLHRRLIYQVGRELVDRDDLRQLMHLQSELEGQRLPDSLAQDWRFLQQMLGFYRSNGSTRYRDSCRLANLDQLLASPRGRGLLLLIGNPAARDRRSLLYRLKQHYGSDLRVVGITVGQGNARREGAQRMALAPLGPHCHEYYFAQMGEEAFWLDLAQIRQSQPSPWLPRQMFVRSHYHQREDLPFATVNLTETFDLLIYLSESPAARG